MKRRGSRSRTAAVREKWEEKPNCLYKAEDNQRDGSDIDRLAAASFHQRILPFSTINFVIRLLFCYLSVNKTHLSRSFIGSVLIIERNLTIHVIYVHLETRVHPETKRSKSIQLPCSFATEIVLSETTQRADCADQAYWYRLWFACLL